MLFSQAFKPKLAKWEERRESSDFKEKLTGYFFQKKNLTEEEVASSIKEDRSDEALNEQIDETPAENKEIIKKEFVEEANKEETDTNDSVEEEDSFENIEFEIDEEVSENPENLPVPVTDFSAITLTCRYLKGNSNKPHHLTPPKPFAFTKKGVNIFKAKMLKGEKADEDFLKTPKSSLKPKYELFESTDKQSNLLESDTDLSYQFPQKLNEEEDLQVNTINDKRKKVIEKTYTKKEKIVDEHLPIKNIKVGSISEKQENRAVEPKNIPQDNTEIEQISFLDLMESSNLKKDKSDIGNGFENKKEKEEIASHEIKEELIENKVNPDLKAITKRTNESAIQIDFKTSMPNMKSKEDLIDSSEEKMMKAKETKEVGIGSNGIEKPMEKKTNKVGLAPIGKDGNKEKIGDNQSTLLMAKSLETNEKVLLHGSADPRDYPMLNKESLSRKDVDSNLNDANGPEVLKDNNKSKMQRQMLNMFQQFEEKMQGKKSDKSFEVKDGNTNNE